MGLPFVPSNTKIFLLVWISTCIYSSLSGLIPNKEECGRSHHRLSRRIVGGQVSHECEFPWVVAVYAGNAMCGGSLIDSRHVLTAAHCLEGPDKESPSSPPYIKAGSRRFDNMKRLGVQSWKLHPARNASKSKVDFDIAIIKLTEEVVYNGCLSPVCLPTQENSLSDHEECLAAGWGSDLENKSTFFQRKVSLPIINTRTCQMAYEDLIDDTKMCAGDFIDGGIDTCQGDSGGPLMCGTNENLYVQYGVVSFGHKCALPFSPGVYTRVGHPLIMAFIMDALLDE